MSDEGSMKSEGTNPSAGFGGGIAHKSIVSRKNDVEELDPTFSAKAADGSGPNPYVKDYKFLQKTEKKQREVRNSFVARKSMTSSGVFSTIGDSINSFDEMSRDSVSADGANATSLTGIAAGVARKVMSMSFASTDTSNSVSTSVNDAKKTSKKKINPWDRFSDSQIKYKMTQQEQDKIEMGKIKKTFKNSGFSRNLRAGTNEGKKVRSLFRHIFFFNLPIFFIRPSAVHARINSFPENIHRRWVSNNLTNILNAIRE